MARKRKQPGLTRMDAALDQVSCLGFPRPLIRQTVKNLLKVYGDDGWKLIEEDGYKVVLDFILDEQESAEKQNLLTHGESSQQEKTGNEMVIAEVNEIAASFKGSNKASLTRHTENDESCMDTSMDRCAHSGTTQDEPSEDKIKIQSSENAPLTLPASDVAHAPVNVLVYRRKPCHGWISDDEEEETCVGKRIRVTA